MHMIMVASKTITTVAAIATVAAVLKLCSEPGTGIELLEFPPECIRVKWYTPCKYYIYMQCKPETLLLQ